MSRALFSLLLILLVGSSWSLIEKRDILDLDADKLLAKFDKDGDGFLSFAEFGPLYKLFIPHELHSHDHDHDHDHDHPTSEHHDSPSDHHDSPSDHHDDDHHDDHHDEQECLTARETFDHHALSNPLLLNATEVHESVLFMVSMIVFCEEEHGARLPPCTKDVGAAWGYGLLASVVITLASAVGALVIPLRYSKLPLMQLALAFAAGALIGDAFMHVLPEIFGAHTHGPTSADEPDTHGHNHAEETPATMMEEFLGPGLLICATMIIFFMLEKLINYLTGGHHHHSADGEEPGTPREETMDDEDTKKPKHDHDHDDDDAEDVALVYKPKRIHSIGYLALIGDTLHNAIDGLAIGMAFSVSLESGLMTSLAILFHEIPQELGDFALMIHAGFTKFRALLFNLATGAGAILFTIIGLAVGTAAAGIEKWVLCIVAGSFLYIAVGDILPHLNHMKRTKLGTIFQIVGFLLGFAIMLLISMFEIIPNNCA